MLGLVIVYDQAGVNDPGDPAEQRQEKTQDKTEDAAGHQHGNGRKDDAEKVAQRFQGKPDLRFRGRRSEVNFGAARTCGQRISLFQGRARFRLAAFAVFHALRSAANPRRQMK